MNRISVIAPCYDEAEGIESFYERLRRFAEERPDREFEFIFVNDGSRDATGVLLDRIADRDSRVKVIHFAKNRGQQIAFTAGMDFASGDIAVTMDSDLQDPPEVIVDLLAKLEEGYDVVHAQRRSRKGDTPFKRLSARLYYSLLGAASDEALIANCGDFRAFTKPVLLTIRGFREPHRYLRGLFAALGYRQAVIPFDRAPRNAGKTKYPLGKMLHFGLDGILSFSSALLRIVLWIACALWATSLLFLVRACVAHFLLNRTVPGWTSLVVLLTFFTGLNLFCLAVIGLYVGRIFEQGQGRPLYWCSHLRNIDPSALPPTPEVELSKLTARHDLRE